MNIGLKVYRDIHTSGGIMSDERRIERMMGTFLRVPFEALNHKVYERLEAAGYDDIRITHAIVFQHMQPEGIRARELARKVRMTKQSMGALIEYVEERGYVERVPDPRDGRARIIRFTERGWAVNRLANQTVRDLEAEWARELGVEQFAELRRLLQALAAVVER